MTAVFGANISRRVRVAGAGAGFLAAGWPTELPAANGATVGPDAWPYLSLRAVAGHIASRDISPVELTRRMLTRIATVDPILKSYATVMTDQALRDASAAATEIRAGKYRGPLHGVPIGIKDLCFTRGTRTMGGTAVRRNFGPTVDATVIARLRKAGAVILGMLNLSEGAAAGYNPAFDVPINPWNHDRWPGMSSSGAGVAAAAGRCFAAIGTDTGGAIRMPSSANGGVGRKPTYGRVSRCGVLAMAPSLDHVGSMAREVGDAAILFDAFAGAEPRDPTSLIVPPAYALAGLGRGVRGTRIGVDRDYALKGIDGGQALAIEAALRVMPELGATIVDVRTPDLLAAARNRRAALTAAGSALLVTVDAVAGPAGGDPAWPITHALQVGPMGAYHQARGAAAPRSAEFTMPMDMAGVPAICLPSCFSAEGLPYSIQFTGRRLSESMLCRIAHAYERATPWHLRHPVVEA